MDADAKKKFLVLDSLKQIHFECAAEVIYHAQQQQLHAETQPHCINAGNNSVKKQANFLLTYQPLQPNKHVTLPQQTSQRKSKQQIVANRAVSIAQEFVAVVNIECVNNNAKFINYDIFIAETEMQNTFHFEICTDISFWRFSFLLDTIAGDCRSFQHYEDIVGIELCLGGNQTLKLQFSASKSVYACCPFMRFGEWMQGKLSGKWTSSITNELISTFAEHGIRTYWMQNPSKYSQK